VSIYSEDNLNEALEAAAGSYCDQMTSFLPKERVLVTSRLFLWYARDFGDSDAETVRYSASWCMLSICHSANFKINELYFRHQLKHVALVINERPL